MNADNCSCGSRASTRPSSQLESTSAQRQTQRFTAKLQIRSKITITNRSTRQTRHRFVFSRTHARVQYRCVVTKYPLSMFLQCCNQLCFVCVVVDLTVWGLTEDASSGEVLLRLQCVPCGWRMALEESTHQAISPAGTLLLHAVPSAVST